MSGLIEEKCTALRKRHIELSEAALQKVKEQHNGEQRTNDRYISRIADEFYV